MGRERGEDKWTNLFSIRQIPHSQQQIQKIVNPSKEALNLISKLIVDVSLVEELAKLRDEEGS